jgi:hypothetical protein
LIETTVYQGIYRIFGCFEMKETTEKRTNEANFLPENHFPVAQPAWTVNIESGSGALLLILLV